MSLQALKYHALHSGVHYLAASFGVADRDAIRREFHPDGEDIAQGLTSLGWARPTRDGRLVLTEAGYRCDAATSDTPRGLAL